MPRSLRSTQDALRKELAIVRVRGSMSPFSGAPQTGRTTRQSSSVYVTAETGRTSRSQQSPISRATSTTTRSRTETSAPSITETGGSLRSRVDFSNGWIQAGSVTLWSSLRELIPSLG